MSGLKTFWDRLGGKAGGVFCLAGFVALFFGWNGAASYDDVPAQFPYLVSGGLVGLALVMVGAALLVVEGHRRATEELHAMLADLRAAVEAMASPSANGHRPFATAGTVVAGASSYHRPECHLVDGRDTARLVTADEAETAGLSPCRICKPTDVLGVPTRA